MAALGRVLVSALNPSAETTSTVGATETTTAPTSGQEPPAALTPGVERLITALRSELDRHGIVPPERNPRARIPLVVMQPWPVDNETGDNR